MTRRLGLHALICMWSLTSATLALAQPEPDSGARGAAAGATATERMASEGALLAWTDGARTGSERAYAAMHGGRTELGNTVVGKAWLTLLGIGDGAPPRSGEDLGLALRAAASTRANEDVKLDFGVQAQLLFHEDTGLDLALALDYEDEGFNLRPEVVATLLVARELGPLLLSANAAYGHGVTDDERFGQLRLAAMAPMTSSLSVGFDSSVAMDLELDEDEPVGEPELDLQVAPAATLVLGVVGLSAQAGVSVSKLRFEPTRVGPAAMIGAGAAF